MKKSEIQRTHHGGSASRPQTISPDAIGQQIHELRGLFDHLNRRYAWLAANFAILAPIFTDERLQKRFVKSNKRDGASVVARALFNSCILDVCTLLLDDDQNRINPSIRRLVRHFLPQQLKKDPVLLDRIAALYSENKTIRRFLTSTKSGDIDLWDFDGGRVERHSHFNHGKTPVHLAGFSNDELRVISLGDDGTFRFWDASTGRPVASNP
jgi:WD40 repeat protein